MLEYILIGGAFCPSVLYCWKASKPFRENPQSDKSSVYAKNLFPEIFEQERNLREDINIIEVNSTPTVSHSGNNIGPNATIFVSKNLTRIDKDVCNYLCKRHLSHILSNDECTASMYAAGSSAVVTCTMPFVLEHCPVFSLATCVMSYIIANNVYESSINNSNARAESFACKYATDEELIAAQRFSKTRIECNIRLHKKHPKFFSKFGEPISQSYQKYERSPIDMLNTIQTELRQRVVSNRITNSNFGKKKQEMLKENHFQLIHTHNDKKFGKFD